MAMMAAMIEGKMLLGNGNETISIFDHGFHALDFVPFFSNIKSRLFGLFDSYLDRGPVRSESYVWTRRRRCKDSNDSETTESKMNTHTLGHEWLWRFGFAERRHFRVSLNISLSSSLYTFNARSLWHGRLLP
jgi:hypothetical protein